VRLSAWIRASLFPKGEWMPGYWGNIPYLLALRALAAGGVWLRFWFNAEGPMPSWTWLALLLAIALAAVAHSRRNRDPSKPLYATIVILDVVLISTAYWYTQRVESDVFLLYALPIFTAAEYLGVRWVVRAAVCSTIAFAVVLSTMPTIGRYAATPHLELMVRVFLPREVCFIHARVDLGISTPA